MLLVQLFDRDPVQVQFVSFVLDGRRATAAHVVGEALGAEGIVGRKRRSLAHHRTALAATNPAHLQIELHAERSARQIAYPPMRAIVEAPMHRPAGVPQRVSLRAVPR